MSGSDAEKQDCAPDTEGDDAPEPGTGVTADLTPSAERTPRARLNFADCETPEGSPFDMMLSRVLETAFQGLNTTDSESHEVVGALTEVGVKSWADFLIMGDEEFLDLKRKKKGKLIDVSKLSCKQLRLLHQMIMENFAQDEPHWDDPVTYTREALTECGTNDHLNRRQNALQRLTHPTSGGPAFGHAKSNKLTMTVTEKECNAWQRRRASKDAFPVLKDDRYYVKWKLKFKAELVVRKMEQIVAHDFDPRAIQDLYDAKSHEQQNSYPWTVLL